MPMMVGALKRLRPHDWLIKQRCDNRFTTTDKVKSYSQKMMAQKVSSVKFNPKN